MTIEELKKYHKILLLGYGVEGQETERFLKKHHPDADIIISDQKEDPDYLDKQNEVDLVVRTPGISPSFINRHHTTATNIFFANVQSKNIIGITGTKGKSTTAALTYHILKTAGKSVYLAGNIGTPMLSILDGLKKDDIIVLELSSYQLQDIAYSPHIALILNLYQELHNHPSFEEYKQAKFNIVKYLSRADYYLYNSAFPELAAVPTEAKKIAFEKGTDEDVNAVTAIASLLKISPSQIESAIKTFVPLPHRQQIVGKFNGVTYIDDSASTHPQSTIEALQKIPNVETLICGGQDRGYSLSSLAQSIVEHGVQNVVFFPDTDRPLEKLLLDKSIRIFKTSSMELAVKYSIVRCTPGSVCLLSPGAASYLTFANFAERGERFVYYVNKYAPKKKINKKSARE